MSVRMIVNADALETLILTAARSPDLAVQRAVAGLVRTGTAPAPPARPWLTVKEAAARFDVSTKTVYRAVSRDEWRHIRLGRNLRVDARGPVCPDVDTDNAPDGQDADSGANDETEAA